MSSAGRVRMAYKKEATFGTAPTTPVLTSIPFNTGDAFVNSRDALISAQVQSTRGPRRTRLGVNIPAKGHSFELQWSTFDELLAAGFGNDWAGGIDVTASVTAAATSLTLASGTWAALGVFATDFLVYDDNGTDIILYIATITAADTILNVVAADQSTPVVLTVVGPASKTLIMGWTGTNVLASAANTIVWVAATKTITLAVGHGFTWLTKGFRAGDGIITVDSVSNDGWDKIASIDSTGLILTTVAALTDETINTAVTVNFGTDTGKVDNGSTLDSFSFEEQYLDHNSDVGNYRTISGVKINSIQFSVQPSSMIMVTMDLQAATIGDFSSASFGASTTDYTNREAFDSFTGAITQDDGSVDLSSFDFTLGNNQNRNFDLFERNARQITDGIPEMTGTINAFFDAETQSTLFFNETEFEIYVRMEDPTGYGYAIEINSAKFTGDTISIGDIDVTEALPYNVEPSTSEEVSLRRQPLAR